MMDDYFKSQLVPFNSLKENISSLSSEEKEAISSQMAATSKNSSNIKVSISSEATQITRVLEANKADLTKEPSIFEPKKGVMVKKEDILYLNGYSQLNSRISMIEVSGTSTSPNTSSLSFKKTACG